MGAGRSWKAVPRVAGFSMHSLELRPWSYKRSLDGPSSRVVRVPMVTASLLVNRMTATKILRLKKQRTNQTQHSAPGSDAEEKEGLS